MIFTGCFERYYGIKEFVKFEDLLGKTLIDISGAHQGSQEIIFTCDDGTKYKMFHMQDCCESVRVRASRGCMWIFTSSVRPSNS